MQILLMSMPDSIEHTPTLDVRMPNGGLASLAGKANLAVEFAGARVPRGRKRGERWKSSYSDRDSAHE